MLYSITCCTKILTLAIASFPFILVGVLRECYGARCAHFIVSSGGRCTLLLEGTHMHIQQHIHQKDLNLCLTLYCYAKLLLNWKKSPTKNSSVLWYL